MDENWPLGQWVRYDTTILQTLEKYGASPELVEAFKLAVAWIERTFPNLDEIAKAHMAQLKAQNMLLEQRVAKVNNRNDEIRERSRALMAEVDWLKNLFIQRGETIKQWEGVSEKQDAIIEDLRKRLEAALQLNPN